MAPTLAALCTGCYHWSRIDDLAEVIGAARVRIEPENGPPRVLDHPTVDDVRDAAVEEHAHVAVEKLNGAVTGAVIGGSVLAVIATVVLPVMLVLLAPRPVPFADEPPPP